MATILAFGSHPDDIEFGCGGILAKMSALGHSIVMADLTLGEKASNGTPEIRREEAQQAAKLIGAKRVILDFPDCEIFDTYQGRLKLVRVIREYRPEIVLAPMWQGMQNHPDHTATGSMARHACRYARFAKILSEIAIHRPKGILHYLQRNFDVPQFLVDISEYVETWKQMISCHQSQLKTHDYLEWNLKVAARLGVLIGVPYAQGLAADNPVLIEDLMHISRGTLEL